MQYQELQQFLLEANRLHAFGTLRPERQKDRSRTIASTSGSFTMNDNFFGGEPYGGRQVISIDGEPHWICLYYGSVDEEADTKEVYDVLREALQNPDREKPYRGPDTLQLGQYTYQNSVQGDIVKFSGRERIMMGDNLVYWADYMGGLVNQREKDAY